MAGYKGHIVGGVVAYALLFFILKHQTDSLLVYAQWFGCALAGALFPDIDVKSKGQKYFYWLVLAAVLYLICSLRFEMIAVISVLSITPMLSKHRGLFHEPWFVIMIPLLLWLCVLSWYPQAAQQAFLAMIFFIVGALSHLFLDRGWRGIFRLKYRR